MVERLRNRLIDLGGEVQRAGQLRRGEHLNAVLPRLFPDPRSNVIGALGQQDGRAIRCGIVGQGHSKVLGVGDHDIGVLDLGDHAGVGHLALAPADLLLHLGPALAVLHLILDLLLGHAQLLEVAPALVGCVNGRNQEQAQGEPNHRMHNHLAGGAQGGLQPHIGQAHQLDQVAADQGPQHQADHGKLGERLDQLDQCVGAKHALEPADGAELAELGRKSLGRKVKPAGHPRCGNGDHRCDDHQGQHHQQTLADGIQESRRQQRRRIQGLAVKGKAVAHLLGKAADPPTAHERHRDGCRDHHRCRRQLDAAHDIALLDRLAQAPGGGLFCSFCAFFAHGPGLKTVQPGCGSAPDSGSTATADASRYWPWT